MAQSIASLVTRCIALLKALLDTSDGIGDAFLDPGVMLQMIDEQSRFRVWSGSIGAHRFGMSSLDYRLRDASHVKSQVVNLLKDFIGLIEDALAIATGQEAPWDQKYRDADEPADADSFDGSPPDTELGQIALDMADVVNCLLRLSVAIRNPAPHDRYVKTKLAEKSHFEPFDIRHVHSKFGQIQPWLAERLGKAISRRRQYLKYRESHHEKLAYGLDQDDVGAHDVPEAETVASSIPSHLKDGGGSSSQIQARLPIFRDDGSDAGMSQTSYATSIAHSDELTIPPLPKEAQFGPFQCGFCYMIIVVQDRASWKYVSLYPGLNISSNYLNPPANPGPRKHVYGDLQPCRCPPPFPSCLRSLFSQLPSSTMPKLLPLVLVLVEVLTDSVADVCLEDNCVTPEREYPRRHEWMEHVRQHHWKTYRCPTCQSPFSSFADCKNHVLSSQCDHPAKGREAELEALVKLSEHPLDIGNGVPCPLCHEILNSEQKYQRHVGRHQEQLSLFALPSFDPESEPDEETDDDEGSDEDNWEDEKDSNEVKRDDEEDSNEVKRDDPLPEGDVPLPKPKSFQCTYHGCGKIFKRQADLDRHTKVMHAAQDKTQYLCDYKKCSRHTSPFLRQDHFRDHLREYHREDLPRRGHEGRAEWWAERYLSKDWWRCTRCLKRVDIKEHGFVCSTCGSTCEKERQQHRMAGTSTGGGSQAGSPQ